MARRILKRSAALLLALCVLMLAMPLSSIVLADEFIPENLLMTDVKSITPVIMNISSGAVSDHNQFNGGGAVATLNDGNTGNNIDVYGANDWGNYSGVIFELNDEAYCGTVSIFSGFEDYPDTYKVYASNSSETLYSNASIVSDGVVCKGAEQSLDVNRTVKYLAIFLTDYTYNGRIAEVQLWSADNTGVVEFIPENLMIEGVESITPVIKNISSGTVQEHNQFNGGGAVATLNDGNTGNNMDVYGANDWGNYSGVVIELKEAAYCGSVSIYSGFADYPDTYEVYASDTLDALYSSHALVADAVVCKGAEQSLEINRTVKYVAIFLTDYTYNGRIAEVQIWTGDNSGVVEFLPENLMINGVDSITPVIMNISSGAVQEHGQFNVADAVTTLNDGNTGNNMDVYGANDWGNYSGVVIELKEAAYCGSVSIYSGFADYPDTYSVYASDSIDTLYTNSSVVAEGVVCKGTEQSLEINRTVKYVAIFLTDYTYNGRIAEVQIWTADGSGVVEFKPENVLLTDLAEVKSVTQYGDGSVAYEEFISAETLAKFTDGDISTHSDFNGTLEWDPPRSGGAEFTLNEATYIGTIEIYAAIGENFPEAYKVYASDDIETLYTEQSLLVENAATSGKQISVEVNKEIKYMAFFCVSYTGNPRFKEIEAYTACAHAQTEVRDAKEATETEDGYTGDTYCLICGALIAEGEVIPATGGGDPGNTPGDYAGPEIDPETGEVIVPAHYHTGGTATCHSKAVCTICSAEYGEYDANNHDGGTEIRGETDSTCTVAGYTGDTYCLGCGEKIADGTDKPLAEHTVGEWVTDAGSHWHVCTVCTSEADKAAHSGGTATCHSKAVCEVCGVEYGEYDADNHDGETEVRGAVAATETEDGYTGDTYCLGCGELIAAGKVIPATGGEPGYSPGDINGDGEVDNKDLTRLFQFLSNWEVEVNEEALDVNGDGSVDNKDLTRLFQYLSNWEVEIF